MINHMSYPERDEVELLNRVKLTSATLRASLPHELGMGAPSTVETLEFKASLFREFLMDRLCDSVDGAVLLCEAGQLMSALLLTHAALATTVMLHWFGQETAEYGRTRDSTRLESLLMRGSVWRGGDTALDQACDVFLVLNLLDKEARGFKQMADVLFEFTDMNYAAAVSRFGHIDRKNNVIHLVEKQKALPCQVVGTLLRDCLMLAKRCYADISRERRKT